MHIVFIPLYFPSVHFSPVDRACAGRWGVCWVCWAGAAVSPLLSWFLFFFCLRVFLLPLTYLVCLGVMPCFFFFPVAFSITYLFVVPCVILL